MSASLPVRTLALACLVVFASDARSQRFYGVNPQLGVLFEGVPYPGGDCSSPWSFTMECDYTTAACGLDPLAVGDTNWLHGDVAVDRIKDTVYVTDGNLIYEFVGDTACGNPAPCTPLNAFEVPISLGMGTLTGMAMDAAGTISSGAPTLWITDGTFIAGLEPGPCSASVLFPPCQPSGLQPDAVITDITWNTGSALGPGVYACDNEGFVYHIPLPGCVADWTQLVFISNPCFGNPFEMLTGIAFDTTTPNAITGQPDTLFVTNGGGLAVMDAGGTGYSLSFHAGTECSTGPFPQWATGLAMNLHGIEYGTGINDPMSVETYGSSTSPSLGFGLEVIDAPLGTSVFLVVNFNTTVPNGYLCPHQTAIGKDLRVNPVSAIIMSLGTSLPPCLPLPVQIPTGIPQGFEVYAQAFAIPSGGPPAVEASLGAAFTIGRP